jgi:hypothetical protein
MSKSINEIRAFFRKKIPEYAGLDGERYAEKWLAKSGWTYEKVEQGKYSLSEELRNYGGKRPDFIVDPGDGSFVLLDAKYHSTGNGSYFRLTDAEIWKYRALKAFSEQQFPGVQIDMLFMVMPKEHDGTKLVWVCLSEFEDGESSLIRDQPATEVSLVDRADLWCDIEG